MAALSLFPAISDDFSVEFFAAIAVILTDKIQLTQFPSFFDRLNRTVHVLHFLIALRQLQTKLHHGETQMGWSLYSES